MEQTINKQTTEDMGAIAVSELEKFMNYHSLSSEQCGRVLGGYNNVTVWRWCNGKTDIPHAVIMLLMLCKKGVVSIDDLNKTAPPLTGEQ